MIESYKFKVAVQVRYSDFDMLGHLNNAAYATYLEVARLHYLKKLFKENSIQWLDVVASITINFRKPVLPENKPVVFLKCCRIGKSSYDLEYLVVNEADNEIIFAEGKTVQVFIDAAQNTPTAISPEARKILENN